MDTPFTKEQKQALALLATGGARYGTRIAVMKELKDMGLCKAHYKASDYKKGRWVWRPTDAGMAAIASLLEENRP